MNIIAQNKRYLPHEISTKVQSVQLYRLTKDISFVCRRYHISKASLMRWNRLYNGTKESLFCEGGEQMSMLEELWLCGLDYQGRPVKKGSAMERKLCLYAKNGEKLKNLSV